MQISKTVFAITAFLACSVLAAPVAEAGRPFHALPPPPPPPASHSPPSTGPNTQSNNCGNGASQYCCNTEATQGSTTCYVYNNGQTCSSTQNTICCNNNVGIQQCVNTPVNVITVNQ